MASSVAAAVAKKIPIPKGIHIPGVFLTEKQKLRNGEWPWTEGIRSRLPEHYKTRYMEKYHVDPEPVHWKPDTRKYYLDKYGTRQPVVNAPILPTLTKLQNEGLWGGEGLVQGFRKKDNKTRKPRVLWWWRPCLTRRVVYSEILDEWLIITCTLRTLDLVDKAYGFDNYILKTHEVDLASKLGMRLKRAMLLALSKKTLYQDNPEKQQEILEKYKEFIVDAGEADWIGLTLHEAEIKQQCLEDESRMSHEPLKIQYMEDLIKELKEHKLDELEEKYRDTESSWMSRLNPFKSTTGDS